MNKRTMQKACWVMMFAAAFVGCSGLFKASRSSHMEALERDLADKSVKHDVSYFLKNVKEIHKKHRDRSSGLLKPSGVEANEYIEAVIAMREKFGLSDANVASLWHDYAGRSISLYRDEDFIKGYENTLKLAPGAAKWEIVAARHTPHYRLLKELKHFPRKEKELNFGQTLKTMGIEEKKTVHLKDYFNPTNMTAVFQKYVDDPEVTTIVLDKMPSPYYIFSVKFGPNVNGKRVLLKSGVTLQRVPWELRHLRKFKCRGPMLNVKGAKNLIIESDASDPREAVVTFYNSRAERLKVNRREGDSCIAIGGGKSRNDTSINIVIRNLHLRDSEQDGIAIGALWRPSEEVYVENVIMDSNFRQGTSPCAYYSLYFKNCQFINTRGGPPSAGCDVEPWDDYLCTGILYFFDCTFANNDGGGLEFATSTKNPLLCMVKRCKFLPTPGAQFNITARPTGYLLNKRRPYSDIIFEDCEFSSLGSSISFMPCPIYDTTFRNCVIKDARSTARKAASKVGPSPIKASLNRDFGMSEFAGDLRAKIKFENVRIEGFENSEPLGVSDELGKLSIKNVFSGVVDWNGKKVDFSKVNYDAPDINEPPTKYVDLKKLKKPSKLVKDGEMMPESNAVLCYNGAWWLKGPKYSYYFYVEKGHEISFDLNIAYSIYQKNRPVYNIHVIAPSSESIKIAEHIEGTKTISFKAKESGWHRFSPGEDITLAQWYVTNVKGTLFSWQADTKSDSFAKFVLRNKEKSYTGYFEVPAGGKECRIRVNYGGFELYDPAGNLVDKIGSRDYLGRYTFTIKPSTDKAEIWSFRTPCSRSGGQTRALRFYYPLNGIWADSIEALALEYDEHFVPAKKKVLAEKVKVRKIDRSILSKEQISKLDAAIAERKVFAKKMVNSNLVKDLEAQINKMSEGKRNDDTEKQLADLRRGLDLVKRAAEMEVKASGETAEVAEAAAFVQAFADLLGVDKNAFGVSFPKDVVEYEYPFDLNSTIDAIVAVIKEK